MSVVKYFDYLCIAQSWSVHNFKWIRQRRNKLWSCDVSLKFKKCLGRILESSPQLRHRPTATMALPAHLPNIAPTDALPKIDTFIRQANKRRQGSRPANPTTLDFDIQHDTLPDGFLQKDIRVGNRRHLMFLQCWCWCCWPPPSNGTWMPPSRVLGPRSLSCRASMPSSNRVTAWSRCPWSMSSWAASQKRITLHCCVISRNTSPEHLQSLKCRWTLKLLFGMPSGPFFPVYSCVDVHSTGPRCYGNTSRMSV